MSEGLIGKLQPHCFGVCFWDEAPPEDEKDALVSRAAVLALLRSDETVEAVRRVHVQHAIRTAGYGDADGNPVWTSWECLGCDVALADGDAAADHLARAVLRVLAGDPAEGAE